MNLREVSFAMRVAAELAHTGERLFASLATSRRMGWPLLIGMGVGVGIGALIFNEGARKRVITLLVGSGATRIKTKAVVPAARPS